MNTDTKIIIGAVVASVLIIIGASFVLSRDNSPKRGALGVASMTIDKKEDDFGDMKVDDERAATFTITNTSDAMLRIWGVSTSCDCTFANVTIGGQKTGEFNMPMHMAARLKNWIGEVPAGEKAILEVIYRPSVMPVSGAVSRQVRFSTNDPKNAEIEVSVKANVE
ncbi:MAG TPA: DUF1573 domain-containing protein [Patescibacteria group bacterium]|nr:DUF1573 domain-containing protein [Patescibacteria group bacterium]